MYEEKYQNDTNDFSSGGWRDRRLHVDY